MELSREVHTLLERIKKLKQHAQKNEPNINNMPYNLPLKISQLNLNSSYSQSQSHEPHKVEDVQYSSDELINVDCMDFSDNERWLYVSEMSMISPYTGDLTNWLHQDFNTVEDDISELESLNMESTHQRNSFVDTRTFTRPKKRISRPSLEQLTEAYTASSSSSKTSLISEYHDVSKMSLTEESSNESSYHSDYLLSNTNSVTGTVPSAPTAPVVQFKLSEPVNIAFDRILANAGESLDSFTNMSPPSLINSLCCSSTFTNQMDSSNIVPNDISTISTSTSSIRMQTSINENDDPNISKALNDTYNLSGTNTITKKSYLKDFKDFKDFKASCPDINRTFQKSRDSSLDLTFQKLSDSQPNLTEDLKRTIFNQSMELMNPTTETYHSARSGSADSLDERSSSVSNSSKDSVTYGGNTKILNMGDLDNLAKAQELRLQQAMSTPKGSKSRMLLLPISPIAPAQNVNHEEEFLSDSDLSDSCVTARSGFSKPEDIPDIVNATRSLPNKPEVRKSTLRCVPTMIVKPMEVTRTMIQPNRTHSAQNIIVRPKTRMSGLPRPMSTLGATGIPRPSSRIPGPKTLRPPSIRPNPQQLQQSQPQSQSQSQSRTLTKTNWMDGCY